MEAGIGAPRAALLFRETARMAWQCIRGIDVNGVRTSVDTRVLDRGIWYLRQPRRYEPEALPLTTPFREVQAPERRLLFHKAAGDTSEAMHLTVSQPRVGTWLCCLPPELEVPQFVSWAESPPFSVTVAEMVAGHQGHHPSDSTST